MLHIPIVHAHDVSKQIPREKNFPSGWKCYKTIGSYVSCAFIEIWSTWEVWRALKKLGLLSATPRATLTHLSCSPNFPRASYLDERTLTYKPIVNYNIASKFVYSNLIARACFIFLLCTLMTSANKSLEKKIFHQVENVIKQLVHTSAVCSSRYEALGKFGEHSRS